MTHPERDLEPVVLRFCRKYRFDEAHARAVAQLADDLADGLSALADLDGDDRVLLRHAALVHDVGYFVSGRRHHRHSEYLVREDQELRDYPPEARLRLSLMARAHRKRLPDLPDHWGRRDVDRFHQTVALLRLADGLDYGHNGAASVAGCHIAPRSVTVRVAGMDPMAIERVLRRKSALFQAVFGLAVSVLSDAAATREKSG